MIFARLGTSQSTTYVIASRPRPRDRHPRGGMIGSLDSLKSDEPLEMA